MSAGRRPPPPPPPPPPAPPPPGVRLGYPTVNQGSVPRVRHSSHLRVIGLLALTLVLAMAAVVGVSVWLTPTQRVYVCPPDCGHPPVARAVSIKPRFTGPNGSFTVEYEPTGRLFKTGIGADGVTDTFTSGDGGTIRLFGIGAQGRTAQQVAAALIRQAYPNARRAYVIPNAVVGFRPGYGEVDDITVQSANGGYRHDRVIVMVAVKNDLALVGEAFGPYHKSAQRDANIDDGHATAASLQIAVFFFDPLINSFTWRGDPLR